MIALYIFLSLLTGSIGYIITRYDFRKNFDSWTCGDRKVGIILAVIAGPIFLIASLIVISTSGKNDKEVKW